MIYDINGKKLLTTIADIALSSQSIHGSVGTGVQSSFVTGSGKVWMITQSGTCYVVNNGTLVKTITLDHAVGHANNANGCAYVSDWTDPTIIHVFAVNDTNNTMTWVKDISVPITYGRTDYFVFDNETQIYSLSWDTTHSGDSQYMIAALWKKGNDGVYVKAYECIVSNIEVAQGMCVKNGNMYVVNNTSAYKHIGLVIVDLATGEQISDNTQAGTILTLETEGISSLPDGSFLVTAFNGAQFLLH